MAEPVATERSRERSVIAIVMLALIGIVAGGTLAAYVARLADANGLVPTMIGTLAGAIVACAIGRRRLARTLPRELDGWFARCRVARVWFAVAVVLALFNTARLVWFVGAPSAVWASAFPPVPESARHQCIGAYVRAGELAKLGRSNLWDSHEYDMANSSGAPPDGQTATRVVGLAPYLTDAYEYPPPFVVLPRAALAATNDYQLIRIAWYGLSAVGFWLAFLAIAMWMRGRAGATALLLAPLVALSFPLALGLQFGQAHVAVVAAAIAGTMLLARERYVSGGVLLAFAITTKIFPGLLLVHLAMRRQWRAVLATLAACAVIVGIAAAVLGPATFGAFASEHLPRIANGEAFAFAEGNPDNNSVYGLAFKLNMLGVDAGRGLANLLAWAWTLVAIVLTALASRPNATPDGDPTGDDERASVRRARDVLLWLAIICMATLRAPFAPSYTAIGSLWLMAVALGVMHRRAWITVLIGVAWFLLQGAPPLGSPAANAAAALPAQLASIAIAVLAALPRRERT